MFNFQPLTLGETVVTEHVPVAMDYGQAIDIPSYKKCLSLAKMQTNPEHSITSQ